MSGSARRRPGFGAGFERESRTRKRRNWQSPAAFRPLRLVLEQLEDRLLLTGQPDLVITAAGAPATAVEGDAKQIAITWTVKNEGTAPAAGQWYDAIYLSHNGVIDKNSFEIDSLNEMFQGPLAVGASYTVDRMVTVPASPAGNQSFIIRADDDNAFGDQGAAGNTNVQTVNLTPPNVDLAVTGTTLSTTSVVGGDGQQVNVSWTVKNQGSEAAAATWNDAVYVSSSPTLDSSATKLYTHDNPTDSSQPLAAGASYTAHATLNIPDLAAGPYYLIFSANDNHNQGESDQASETNDAVAKPLTVTSPGNVDLTVSGVTVNGGTSQQTVPEGNGQSVSVAYTVTNNGTAAANASWQDSIYLSSKNTLDSTATQLDQLSPPASASGLPGLGFAAGASYTKTDSVTIPQWATGTQYLLIETDSGDVQSETGKANNLVAVPITLTAPAVDLKVTNISTNVAAAVVGNEQSVAVTYTVQNVGTDAAQGTWYDDIYLATKQTYDSSADFLTELYQGGNAADIPESLSPGASYTITTKVGIPDWNNLGTNYLLVVANSDKAYLYDQAETDDTNNVAATPITLTAPAANLTISNASATTAPSSSPLTVEAGNGQSLNLAWTVTNTGTADANSTWTDNVFLANDANFDASSTSLFPARYYGSGISEPGLPAGANYTERHTMTIPNMPAGDRNLVFVTDQNDNQSESLKSDNIATLPVIVTTPNVDLTITGTAAATAIEGATIPVSWTVTNTGAEAAAGSWSDAVYLSDDPTLDDSATLLTTLATPSDAPLAAGTGSYRQKADVTIPAAATGLQYLLFVANKGQTQGETNYANDVSAVPITLSAPNLTVTAANVTPSGAGTVVEGGLTSITWTVQNSGAVAAPATWSDSVFISDQPYFDRSTIYINSFNENSQSGLAAGASYNASGTIYVPQFATGTAFLLFAPDLDKGYHYNGSYYSYGFGRGQPVADAIGLLPNLADIKAVQVTLAAPDLSVTAASVAGGAGVEGGTVNVSWTVKNLSADTAAPGSWSDAIYLSSKSTFDSSAVFLTSFDESSHSGLAAGASYTDTQSVTLPQFATGSQYLLVVADYQGGQPQSDHGTGTAPDANDVIAAPITLSAPTLKVTVASADVLNLTEGGTANLSWTVQNTSADTPAPAKWIDSVFLSSKPTFDSSAVYLSSFGQGTNSYASSPIGTLGDLAPGGGYNETGQVTLPQFATGGAYLLVVADYFPYSYSYYGYNYGTPVALQPEAGREGATPTTNDVFAIPITLAAPDLKATGATAPATIVEGQKTDVSWTVRNAGTVAAPATWYDSVYVSRKPIYDSSAVYLGSYNEAGHAGLAAGGGYFDNEQISVPHFDTGTAYLLFVTDYGSSNGPYYAAAGQPQSDFSVTAPDANDVYALKVTLAAPDLTVTGATAPPTLVEGQPSKVSWTAKNAGAVPTGTDWSDTVYVSSKPTYDSSAVLLGAYREGASALAGGASYSDTQWITVPQFPVGGGYLLFMTNANDNQPESDGGGISDPNNTYAVPITLTAPDLSTIAATAPANVLAGGQISVSWTVKNLSADSRADQTWYDSVYISPDNTFDSKAVLIQSFDESKHTGLMPGANYTDTENVTVPASFAGGNAYLLFVADYGSSYYYYYPSAGQPQSDFSGSAPDANDVFAKAVIVAAANSHDPDLQVSAASATPTAAVEGNGDTIAVSYTVTNNSAFDAKNTWYDAIYASDKPTWDASDTNQIQLISSSSEGPLAAGKSYTVNQNVTLPVLPTADKYLLFVTNVYGYQAESDGSSGYPYVPDANDVKAVPITLSAPNVDLQITAATLPAANATLTIGDLAPVSFTVKNAGTDAAGAGWQDDVYYSQKSTLDSSAIELANFNAPLSPLAAGESYTQNRTVQLADYYYRNIPLGPGYLLYVVDGNQKQSTAAHARSVAAVPITVAAPDLAVTAASAPASAAAGDTVTVQYTVTNQGGVYADANWQDSVYISDKQTFDSGDPNQKFIATLTNAPDELAPNGSYTRSEQVTLPNEALGQWYLLVVANSNGGQRETDTLPEQNYTYVPPANDVKSVPITYVAGKVDLAVKSASAPSGTIEAGNGALASVTYVVTNQGADAATQKWQDKLYISSSATFDSTAKFVANLNNPAASLAAGANYTVTQNVTLPPVTAGPQYLLFVPDADGGQPETGSAGDVKAVAITTSSSNVNLAASGPVAPSTSLYQGQKVELKFTVTNNGSETAAAAWTDAVYLSTKSTLDSSAIQLISVAAPQTLANGANYQFDQTVTIPATFSGAGYLLLVTNDNGAQGETDGAGGDDVANLAVTVSAPGLPTLAVTAASIPAAAATATAGQTDSVAVTYTVANQGTGPAAAPWRDDLYLSDKQTFDPGDPNQQYVTSLNSTTNDLAAGDNYTTIANVTLPPTAAGPHYLLVVADGDGAVTETDNSAGPSAGEVKAVPINFVSPNVDLQLTSATVNGGSPAAIEAGNGATVSVSYAVTNAGTAATTQTWADKLYISNSQTFDASATFVADLTGTATAVAASGSYSPASQNVTLPPVPPGAHYLLFVTNADGGQPESDSTGAGPDANDVKAVPITTTAPHVDLAASNPILVTANPAAGQPAEVKFTVTNNGSETAAAAWTDTVYLSTSSTFSPSATLLGSFPAASTLAAGASYTFDQSVVIPSSAASYSSQNYFLLFVTNNNGAQGETDGLGGDDVASLSITVAPAPPPPTPLPDLQMTSVALVNDATSTADSDGQAQVTWTVTNDGTAAVPANQGWYDFVYLSPTAAFDSSTAVYLSQYNEQSGAAGIAVNGTYSGTLTVNIPENTAAGSYYLIVFANRYGYLAESDNRNGATDTNNIGSTALTVQSADLKMTAATVNSGASATAIIGNGAALSLSETVQNASAGVTANGYWYDEVFLSTKNTYDASAVYVADFSYEYGPLAPASAYTLNTTWNVGATVGSNNTPLTPGHYFLLFVANAVTNGNGTPYLGESDNAGGQYADTNNVMALPLTLTAANVNLGVSSPATPATAVVGQGFPVSFTVANSGSDTASAPWTDAVYFSYKPTLDSSAVRIASNYASSALAANGSYTFSQNVTIPTYDYSIGGTPYPGSGYLFLVTNDNHAQAETDEADDTNDVLVEPITISAPDLAVTSVTAPAHAYLNDSISVSWTVKNVSASDAAENGWYDQLFLSTDPTGQSGSLGYLGSFYEASTGLAAGSTYTDTHTVTIRNSIRTGDVYLIVEADDGNAVGDSDRLNNYYAVPIHLAVPNADLAVSNVQAVPTPSPAALGGSVKVSWTVTNTGTLAANANWVDDVFVSTKSTLDNSAVYLGYVNAPPAGSSPLAPNGAYNDSATFTLGSYVPTGQDYFFVKTNANGAQGVSDTTNAVGVSAAVTVAAPDLTVTAATAEGATSSISAALGQTIPITWTVQNIGAVAAPATWYDNVYISSKPTLDGSAKFIQSYGESSHAGLAAGATYTDSETIQIPNVALGQQYLLFVTDAYGGQPESNTANDVFSLPITLSAPDLAVTTATAPASATLGDPFTVSWNVANLGAVPALSTWTDSVYVSNVPVLDVTATLLHTYDESSHSGLAANGDAGSSYTDSETVTLPSTNIGARYLLFVTNSNGHQGEIDSGHDTNDVFAVPITVSGADLAVTSPSAPSLAAAGATVTVGWTVLNQGNAAADASWTDAVYFSPNSFLDGSAVLAKTFPAVETLSAGGQYSETQQVTIPVSAANAKYVLIVTNNNRAQAESDVTSNGVDANDVAALPIQIASVDLTAASLTAPASADFGDTVDVSWTVNTASTLPIQADFHDSIYISAKNTFDNTATRLTSVDEKALLPIAVNGSYTQTDQVTIPLTAASAAGSYYLYVVVNDGQRIVETNATNNIQSAPISLALPNLPNLVPTNITVPAAGLTGQSFNVSWTDQNNGTAKANGSWTDRLWISTKNTLDSSAMYLGDFTVQADLDPGAAVARTQQVYAPGAAGTYYVIVQTDVDNGIGEGPNIADNTAASVGTIAIATTPLPDLVVTSVSTPTSGLLSGTTVPVTYTVENQGNAPTQAPVWHDVVLMSQIPNLQLSPDALTNAGVFLEQPVFPIFPANVTALGAGQSYSQTVNVTLPFAASGTWYVYVLTDETYSNEILDNFLDPGPVREANYVNNLGRSGSFTISQSPTPDLVTTKVVAPTQAFSGQPMTVSWTVADQGAGATNASQWEDDVYMSQSQSLNKSAILVGKFNHTGALEPGDAYSDSQSITLPVGVSGPFYFIVQTDSLGANFEAGALANNIQSTTSATTVNLTPPPQLAVSGVTAPATALASHTLNVSYTVTNIGATATPPEVPPGTVVDPHNPPSPVVWTDTVYLAAGATLNTVTDLKLGDITHNGALAPNASYTQTVSFTLPNALSGTFHVFVVTDSGSQVFQVDRSQDSEPAANATVVSSKPAQLVVTAASAPAAADPGQIIPMTWTVTNQGTGDSAVTYWVDKVYATTASALGPIRTLLATIPHNGLLGAGVSYTDTEQVQIPYALNGQYNLFVYTNAPVTKQEDGPAAVVSPPGGWVYETNPSASISAAIPIAISAKLAQLQVSNVAVTPPVGGAASGQPITVNWTIGNVGTAATSSSHWYDDVYLSPSSTFQASTAIYLGSAYENNPLAAGAQVNESLAAALPANLAAGNYYVIVLSDRPIAPPGVNIVNVQQTIDLVTEPVEFNQGVSPQFAVALSATPDLTTSVTSAPTAALAGQTISVDWTVKNNGTATPPAPNNTWYDEVYLALDTTFDAGADIPLGNIPHVGGLAAGGSYAAAGDFQLPAGVAGNYYVLVVADVSGEIFSRTPTDRVGASAQAADISLQPPINLVAGTVTVPAGATPGQPITVTYTVSNSSAIADPGDWTDVLYLSPTTSWQLADPLLGRVHHLGGIAANGSYSETLTAPLPGVTPGTYYVILRTDALDQVPETDKVNNVDANDFSASASVSLDVPALTPGTTASPPTPTTGTLTEGASAYYKLTVAAGQTVQIALADADALDVNELYASFGAAPSASQFDFRGGSALSAGQTITIATTQAGTYYILVKNQAVDGYNATSNPNATARFSIAATIIDFSVTAVAPAQVGNAGSATLEIDGAKFDRATTFQLIDSHNNVTQATAIDVADGTTAYATFNLAGMAIGSYTVQATAAGGTTTQLAAGLTVVAGQGPNLQVATSGKTFVRFNRENLFDISYGNSGDADMPAPLIFVTSAFGNPMSALPGDEQPGELVFLANSFDGPAGILRPGEHATVPIYFITGSTSDPFGFQVSTVTTTNPSPMDWSVASQDWIPPADTSLPNWNAIYAQLQKQMGSTWGDFVQALDRDANMLPADQAGNPTDEVGIEIAKAEAAVSTSISGRVTAADLSIPMTNEYVDATNTTTGDVFSALIYQDGSFFLSNLTPGSYALTVDFALVASGGAVSVSSGQQVQSWTLSLGRGADINGTVLTAATSTPVPAATIRAVAADGTTYNAVSNASGTYLLTGLNAGIYEIVADAAGMARVIIPSVTVGTSDVTENISFAPQATISGAIEIPAADISNLAILAEPAGNTDPNQLYESANQSSFVIGGLPAGTYDVTVSNDGYLPVTMSGVVVAAGAVNLGAIQLVKPATIAGTVTSNTTQVSAAGLTVELLEGGNDVAEVQTDANGAFTFSNLAAGTYSVHALSEAGIAIDGAAVVVAGESLSGVAVTIQPGGTVSGTLTDSASGKALSGLPVSLLASNGAVVTVTTDSKGNYQFANLTQDDYSVFLPFSPPTSPQSANITGVSTTATVNFSVSLAYQTQISGTITDGQGLPLANAAVTLFSNGVGVSSTFTAADGSYQFLLLSGGTFDIAVNSAGAGVVPATGVTVATGGQVTQNLQAGNASLVVSITDTVNAPSGDVVLLYMQTTDGEVAAGVQTADDNGNASFSNLAAGDYSVLVLGNGRGAQATVHLTAGQAGTAIVGLSDLVNVTGTITDSSGNPVPNAVVTLFSGTDSDNTLTVTTAADGSYTFANVFEGTYDLVTYAAGFQAVVQTNIAVSTNTALNESLTTSTANLSGAVVDTSANAIAGAIVSVTDAAGHVVGQAVTAANGDFSITSAIGANLTVQVSTSGGGATKIQNVTIGAGASVPLGSITVNLVAVAQQTQPAAMPDMLTQAFATMAPAFGPLDSPGGGAGTVPQPAFTGGSFIPQVLQDVASVTFMQKFGPLDPPDSKCPECQAQYAQATAKRNLANNTLENILKPAAEELRNEEANTFIIGLLETAKLAGSLASVALSLLAFPTIAGGTGVVIGIEGGTAAAAEAIKDEMDAIALFRDFLSTVRSEIDVWSDFQNTSTPASASAGALKVARTSDAAARALISFVNFVARMGTGNRYFSSTGFQGVTRLGLQLFRLLTKNPWENTIEEWEKMTQSDQQLQESEKVWQKQVQQALVATKNYYHCLASQSNEDCNKQPPKPIPIPPILQPLFWPIPYPGTPHGAFDPNDIVGPVGYGDQHFVPANQSLGYTIDFENDPTATAPAQAVVITDKLDPNVDPRSFRLGDFGWSGQRFSVPANSAFYQTTIDETATLGIDVQVTASINVLNDTATWVFQTIDPNTGEPPVDPTLGFLPPDDAFGIGEGFVSCTVMPLATLKTGDVIDAQATVIFDANPPINTKQIFNTIDTGGALNSQVTLPPNEGTPQFTVSWSPAAAAAGSSGVATYTVYVSDDGGPFTPFVSNTSATSAVFNGQNDHTYRFYSVATDNAGNVQTQTTTATTTVGDVVENPLAVSVSATEGKSFSGAVATFTGSESTGTKADFTAEIVWGDGSSTTLAAISGTAATGYTVSGTHTYGEEGTAVPLEIIVSDLVGNKTTISDTTDVADAALTASAATGLTATEGATLSGTLATFTDADPNGVNTDYTATVDWGDKSALATIGGSAMTESSGTFSVPGSHVYAEEGTYTVTVTIADAGGARATASPVVKIADATLSATASPVAAVEGATFNGPLATFTDANPDGATADFTATVDWGDTSALAIISGAGITESGGKFSVAGNHAYAEEGTYTLTVTIADAGGATATVSPVAVVTDAALSATAAVGITGSEGAPVSGTLATFTDADPNGVHTDYTATVDWGDKTAFATIAGAQITAAGGTFSVPGNHTYAEEGTYTLNVAIADAGGATTTVHPVVTIDDAKLTAGAAQTITVTEGISFTQVVGEFSDANTAATTGDFTATITWGDGAKTTGAVSAIASSPGAFEVTGTHLLDDESAGSPISIVVNDKGGSLLTIVGTAVVLDAPLTPAGVTLAAVAGTTFSGKVGTFTDANPLATPSDFTATIDWGDGSSTSTGGVTAAAGGGFAVTGSHLYAAAISRRVTVVIHDAGGASATATSTATFADVVVTSGPVAISPTEGASFSGALATFSGGSPTGTTADFTATILWGDGTSTAPAAISGTAAAGYTVSGTHAYAEEAAAVSLSVIVTDKLGNHTTIANPIRVADAALNATASAIIAHEGTTFTGNVATFTDADPAGALGDYTATIYWGDGASSPGAIATVAGGGFSVGGSHVYTQAAQNLPLKVVIVDLGGASATATGTATVSATPFSLKEDIYVIGSGTITVSAANGVLANDSGPSQLTVSGGAVVGAEGGTFTFHADGSFTYTPPANFPGFDYARYTAKDASGDQGTATVNVLSQTGGIVWKFYEQVLNRDPDYPGLQGWIQDLLKGGTPGDIAAGFFESTELLTRIISGYYEQYLGRAPDQAGLDYYINEWRKDGGPEQVERDFFVSPEFHALAQAQYGSHGAYPVDWLWGLYERILARPPSDSDLTYWEQQLPKQGEAQVALDFFDSLEAYDNDVTGWYYEYFGRAPSLGDQSYYAQKMLEGATDRAIEELLTNSAEYANNPPSAPPGAGVRLPDYFSGS